MKLFLISIIAVSMFMVGCHSYWASRQDELMSNGMTAEEALTQITAEQNDIAKNISDIKNSIVDVAPIPGPKEPIKEITDYWLYALLAAAGIVGKVGYDKVKKSEPGKLFG